MISNKIKGLKTLTRRRSSWSAKMTFCLVHKVLCNTKSSMC